MNEISMALGGLIGLVLLYYGAEYLVRGGSAIASRSCVSPLVIGLTLVAFGTSAPELFVSTGAALHGLGDICIGNVVGSNICNIALILGLSALIAPLAVNAELFKRDLPMMILASAVLTVVCLFCGGIGRIAGLLFVVGIVVYTAVGIRSSGKCEGESSGGEGGSGHRDWQRGRVQHLQHPRHPRRFGALEARGHRGDGLGRFRDDAGDGNRALAADGCTGTSRAF